jgi:hypothetical protein
MSRFMSVMALTTSIVSLCGSASAESRRIATDQDIAALTVVASMPGTAVVRFGRGPLLTIKTADRLGRTDAAVKTIGGGRVVLEEVRTEDGRETHATVILRDGETGGTRVLHEPPEKPPVATRTLIVAPSSRKPGGR